MNDDVRSCRKCRNLFRYPGYGNPLLCPVCARHDEDTFRVVKEYIRDNPGATMFQTAEACNVPVANIREWLKEDRLEYNTAEGAGLYCEQCGAAIASGRYCAKCKSKMINGLNEMKATFVQKPLPEEERQLGAMRFLNKKEKGQRK